MTRWIPWIPEQASTMAGRVDLFALFLVGLSGFFIVLIAGLELYFALRYRRRHPDEVPLPVRSAVRLEVLWVVIPFILSMIIFTWGASIYVSMKRSPEDPIDVYVTGKQWMWRIQHMEGRREINELHVPVGRKVRLTMTSEDVIHGFFVPAFRLKYDVIPGRYTEMWFEATKPGRYHLFCTEYCGTNHSRMIGWVYAMEPAEYQAWLSGAPSEGSLASTGEALFERLACHTCHRPDAKGRGPVLDDLFGQPVKLADGSTVVADEAYIRESILNPQAKVVLGYEAPVRMPTFQGQVSEDQLLQLIEYIKSLGPTAQAEGGAAATGTSAP
jgi:cytochrome c oxidase subunit 2